MARNWHEERANVPHADHSGQARTLSGGQNGEILRFEKPEFQTLEPGGYIETATAADILLSIDLIRSIEGSALTMIAGAPGVGKTRTLRHYCDAMGDKAVYHTVARGEGNPYNLATVLLGKREFAQRGNDLTTARQFIAGGMGQGRLLVIDEAQYLDQKHKKTSERGMGFEWLRALAEEGDFDLVFCGDLTLALMIEAFPQLQSRMRRPVIIKAVSKVDVAAMASCFGLDSTETITALYHVARHRGGLRNVENVLRMAVLFAGGGKPDGGHLLSAIMDLNLEPKGAN